MDRVSRLASQRPVVIFTRSSCCMCHTTTTLFTDLGVNAAIYQLDEDPKARETERVLIRLGCNPAVPAVFIGGELIGGANEVMACHLSGSLIPLLKQVRAQWL